MGVDKTIHQPPTQAYTLGLNQGTDYTIANDSNLNNVLIQRAGISFPNQNIGTTITGPSYQISYINFETFSSTTDKTAYQLFNMQDDFVSGSILLFFSKGSDIITSPVPSSLNLNYSLGNYYNFTNHKLNSLISMKIHTDKDKLYLLKSIRGGTLGIFEKGSKDYYVKLSNFEFGSSSIGKRFFIKFIPIVFMNSITSTKPK